MAKWSMLSLCVLQAALAPLITGQLAPWRQRIQWENNGQVFSLMSTGSEYQSPVATRPRSFSRSYLGGSGSSGSQQPECLQTGSIAEDSRGNNPEERNGFVALLALFLSHREATRCPGGTVDTSAWTPPHRSDTAHLQNMPNLHRTRGFKSRKRRRSKRSGN
ncbi:hypothetical protein CRUP_026986 [Coryphaenoides rupestris]|nr:hypothetical protein CRUP_026986 [Coryphaenoides rupestris]